MKKNLITVLLSLWIVLLAVLGLVSCEKVIDVDLNSADPRIVIEATLDDSRECVVRLSRTVDFDQKNIFPPVSGAFITLSDGTGKVDSLREEGNGYYHAITVFDAYYGKTFTLTVSVEGKVYLASSTMPPPIEIDSLSFETMSFGETSTEVVNVHFQDPEGIKNYYRFVETYDLFEPQKYIFITDDRLQDGQSITASLFSPDTVSRSGMLVRVMLHCIDEGVYEYLRTAAMITGREGESSASPANPVSNFSGGVLGYFSASSVRSGYAFVP